MAESQQAADRLIAEGNRIEEDGRPHDACALYREAVAAAPGYARAHLNLGIALEAAGDGDAARASYERALAIDPGDAYASYNLGKLLHQRGDTARVETLLRAALEHKPDFPEARVVLARIHEAQGRLEEAAAGLERALEARPDWIGALLNYAAALRALGRLTEAEPVLRRVLALDPGQVDAYALLGSVLRNLARVRESAEALAEGRRLAPGRFDIESAELFMLTCSDDVASEALFARHRDFGARLEATVARRPGPLANEPDPGRRLRVGYVSGDFCSHPVAFFAIPLLERHDRRGCEVYCYSTGHTRDRITAEVRARTDAWRDAASMSDDALAEAIVADRIDVLVDLSGHAGAFRLGVFARQPAPVQATWLGYLSTTGLTRMHYRLCDRHTDPPGAERFHTETLIRLPHSQWCYRPPVGDVRWAPSPPSARNGYLTFGSFHNLPKISPSTRRLWARVLERVPDARMRIVGVPPGASQERLVQDFVDAGVARDRLTVSERLDLPRYFAAFDDVDVALDATPYSGGTTTCDTLWMGVPVIAVPGERSLSRSAASVLHAVGLADWIASGPEGYVERAVQCARDPRPLAQLRATLRERMRASPLMDEVGFARDIEAVYRGAWRAWCAANPRS